MIYCQGFHTASWAAPVNLKTGENFGLKWHIYLPKNSEEVYMSNIPYIIKG